MSLPCASYLKGFLNWHIPHRGGNKPVLQSRHCCTQNSCTICSDWSSNSHPGICSMDGTCICGECGPLRGLCGTCVWAWMSQPWHLSTAVDFNVSTEGSNCRWGTSRMATHTHTHTCISHWASTHTHILAHFTLRGAIMTVLMVSAIKARRISHEGQQMSTSQAQAC